jgi:tetratricopeptide (TPR) repeat protein
VQLFPAWRARQLPRLAASALIVPLMAVFLWANPPDRAVQRRMSAGMAHYNLGLYYTWAAKDDPAQRPLAITHLRQAAELRPTDPAPRRSLGLALARSGEWTAAAEQFAGVVALDPNDVESELTLAQCQQELGHLDVAAQIYRRILARQPRADALTQLGILAARQGDLTAAANDLEQAVALDPRYAPAQHKLGLVRAQQQDYARAAQHFAAAVQADPALLAARLDWATALEQLGRRDEALQVLTAAHKLARAQQPALIPDIQARLQRLSQP